MPMPTKPLRTGRQKNLDDQASVVVRRDRGCRDSESLVPSKPFGVEGGSHAGSVKLQVESAPPTESDCAKISTANWPASTSSPAHQTHRQPTPSIRRRPFDRAHPAHVPSLSRPERVITRSADASRHDETDPGALRRSLPPSQAHDQGRQQRLLQGKPHRLNGLAYQVRWLHDRLGQGPDLCRPEEHFRIQGMAGTSFVDV